MASVISGICSAMRPVAKELIKRGLIAVDTFSEFVAESGEHIKDLVAEAKAEMASEASGGQEKTTNTETVSGNGAASQPH